MLPESYIWDLMDRSPSAIPGDGDLPRWTCDPEVTIKLLDVAREVLLREVGGEDKGGNTTMAQRQRRSSLKDAFAFSCLQIYERTAGPKSACQRARRAWDDKRSPFEHFVRVVHEWAVGPMAPRGWALGPDPIRKAIATQRAWQKLFKTVNCMDEHEFKKLSFESKEDAIRTLGQNAAQRLKPPSVPLI